MRVLESSRIVYPTLCSSVLSTLLCMSAMATARCAYPAHRTPLTPVASYSGNKAKAPKDLYRVVVQRAEVTALQRSGASWDEEKGLPDVFARIRHGNRVVWESPVREDTLTPSWDIELPRNAWLPHDGTVVFELWESDGVHSIPIGSRRFSDILAGAVGDGELRLGLEGGSVLFVRLLPPKAHHGVGIGRYEVRSDALLLSDVVRLSPAGRAGLVPGDRIVALGELQVAQLNEGDAESALALAQQRRIPLSVVKADGKIETVTLDDGYVWLEL